MMTFDAQALLNDFEYCKSMTPFTLPVMELVHLTDLAADKTVGEDSVKAARICEWLLDNPDKFEKRKEHGTIDCTGNYFTALYHGATYIPCPAEAKVDYKGYKLVSGDDASALYDGSNAGCLCGQYALVSDDGIIKDARKWTGMRWDKLNTRAFRSELLGTVEPRDYYQKCAFDSLMTNDITALYGSSGTGKTLLPLAYLMQELESGRITRCHMVYHYEKLKYSRELGYVKGTLQDKLVQTGAIGNILASKLGSRDEILRLINDGVINIMPTNAIRGFEAGETEAVYCTEAQNLDAYTTRTILQRARKGCKVIFEGDVAEQVDISRRSGLGQLIEVFKGTPGFGCIELKNDYRSPYGRIADRIR